MTKMKIDVLGTEYEVIVCDGANEKRLTDCDGICDETIKQCLVESYSNYRDDPACKKDLDVQIKKNIRHELIHAFLSESGLAENSTWAQQDEMVDWFAKQFPKLAKAFQAADAL